MVEIILDLILLLIAGITVYFGIKNGLVKTVINACSLILAAVLSLFACPIFKEYFRFAGEHSEVATYLVVFIISWIVVKIVALLLDTVISALPIISSINTLGGFVLGALLGIFRISIYCIAVGGLISIGDKLGIEFLKDVSIENTYLLKYVYEYNPIYILINFILK